MGFDPGQTTLYRLLDAAQRSRRALLAPLAPYGLLAGDDAVLMCLAREQRPSYATLQALTGLKPSALHGRLERLGAAGLVRIGTPSEEEPAQIVLTDEGSDIANDLFELWRALDGELERSRKVTRSKKFGKVLKKFNRTLGG